TSRLRGPLRLSKECGDENIPDRISLYPVQQIPEQMRHLGACGGRAHGRNQRARRALVATPPEAVPPPAVSRQTAAEAIHLLDTQFSVAARCGKVTLPEPGVVPARAAGADQ